MPFCPPMRSPTRTRTSISATSRNVDLKVFMEFYRLSGMRLSVAAAHAASLIRRCRGGFDASKSAPEDDVKRRFVLGVLGIRQPAGETVRLQFKQLIL